VLQSTCAPTNDNLMEVLLMTDALNAASASRVTAAIRTSATPARIASALGAGGDLGQGRANMLQAVAVDRVLTMDLHATRSRVLRRAGGQRLRDPDPARGRVEAPVREPPGGVADVGGVVRARAIAKRLESDLAIIDKRRPKANVSEVMNIIGTCRDAPADHGRHRRHGGHPGQGRGCLKDEATRVLAYCTHPVLSGSAVQKIEESALDELVWTDSIPLRKDGQACKKIRVLSSRIAGRDDTSDQQRDSVSSLFME